MANSGQSRCYFNHFAATPGVIAVGASIDPGKPWTTVAGSEFVHGYGHPSEALSVDKMRASGWGIAAGSSKGPTADGKTLPTVVAPGVGIMSTCNQCSQGYDRANGTSMATPFVSGVVAALNDAGVSSQSLRKAYIQDTALNVMKVDNKKENLAYGYGYIRPLEAYKQAIASPSTHDGERTRSGFDQVCQSYAYDYTFTVTDSSVPIAANVVISNYYNNNPYDAYLILSKGQWSKWAFTEKHPGGLPHESMVLSLTHENPEPGTYTLTYSPNNWPTVETCFFGNVSYR
jgi:subtilisin family serine protease